MRDRYGANERSQKLKYHADERTIPRAGDPVQRHPHDVAALIAIYDNCNSLHTNAFDEAITTPTEDSVRRRWRPAHHQSRVGPREKRTRTRAFIIDELTELVEEAVLKEFEIIAERGGVLGGDGNRLPARPDPGRECTTRCSSTPASTRRRRQHLRNPHGDPAPDALELARSTDDEKQSQLKRLAYFQERNALRLPRCFRSCSRR
jgi:methylmalonyl-CoA mutase